MNQLQKLSIPAIEGFHFIDFEEILFLKSSDYCTYVHLTTEKKPIVSAKNLGKYEKELDGSNFLRVHNSYIVNLTKIRKYIKADGTYILLSDGSSIPVTRKDELLSALGIKKAVT